MILHGFELIQGKYIPELNTNYRMFRHVKTGAELLSMENDDENKVFGITFRTTPHDSTGVAHILEHAVLNGSEKYPVKEPFIELVKGSLQTFVNAFTYPDKTCYPCASQNLQDFYNLVDVYVDAVFHPLLQPHILDQEGWRLDLQEVDGELTYKGVVFNEMKGALSDPDDLLQEEIQHALFPDNFYGFNSGGDPKFITDLTYNQFKAFHTAYYHPSNSRIYFWGNDPADERLKKMDGYLQGYQTQEVDSAIHIHPPFSAPKQVTVPYASGEDDDKAYLTLGWVMGAHQTPELSNSLNILAHILIGSPAGPLRKALMDSGLGEDICGNGAESDLLQVVFSAGLKGIKEKNAGKVEKLILDTLRDLVENGIDPDTVAASMNRFEFGLRENNTGRFPRGLAVMLRAMLFWLYDLDPLPIVSFEDSLEAIKAKIEEGGYFEGLIEKNLLNNPHRVTMLLKPDADLNKSLEKEEKTKLATIQAKLSLEEKQEIVERTQRIKEIQETPDTPEALAMLPALSLKDIDPKIRTIPVEIIRFGEVEFQYHELPTNGILYMAAGFDMHALPKELVPYMGLLGRLYLELGTTHLDYVRLTQRIMRDTGGIAPWTFNGTHRKTGKAVTYFFLRSKSTVDNTDKLLDILKEVLLDIDLDNKDRFLQILSEERASLESNLIPSGHMVVNNRLNAKFNEAGWLNEQMGGIDYLFFLRELSKKAKKDWKAVLNDLETAHNLLVDRKHMLVNVTVDGEYWPEIYSQLQTFCSDIPLKGNTLKEWEIDLHEENEGLVIPAQVNFVGKSSNLYDLGYQYNGSVSVMRNYIGTTYLWEKLRVQGGAYGGFSVFNVNSGVFSYLTYRDPNLLKSVENFDGTPEFLMNLEISTEELSKSIIGVIGALDDYQFPDAKGYTSLSNILLDVSDQDRQKEREEVLNTNMIDFLELGKVLAKARDNAMVVVMGSKEAIQAVNKEKDNWLKVTKVI
ncbi:MAG: insulinase family protein [Anaerolineales bacterium]|nr:insulinase family protein [Anaerolineales bacterium]